MRGGHPPAVSRRHQLFEHGPPLRPGALHQRLTIDEEHVEDRIEDRCGIHMGAHGVGIADVHPALKGREARLAVLVEGDDLSVEDRLAG